MERPHVPTAIQTFETAKTKIYGFAWKHRKSFQFQIFELILFNGVIMTKFRQKILIFLTRIDEYRTAYYQY